MALATEAKKYCRKMAGLEAPELDHDDTATIAVQGDGSTADGIVRFHAALCEMTGRRGIRDEISRYLYGKRDPQPPPCPSVFPFGIYRGGRMWVVAQDTLYTDKLLRQAWFRTGYPAIADTLAQLRAEHGVAPLRQLYRERRGGCTIYRPAAFAAAAPSPS
jgi:hypothetical protein